MNGKSFSKPGNKPATPYCRTRSIAQEGGSRFCNASPRTFLIDHLPGSSLAANSSRLRFCRRAPFFFIPTSLASPLGPPPMEPLFPIGHCLFNLLVRQFPGGSTKVLGWCPHDGYLVCRDRSSGSLECGSNYCATESELRIARMGNECRKVFCWRSFSLGEATVGAGL